MKLVDRWLSSAVQWGAVLSSLVLLVGGCEEKSSKETDETKVVEKKEERPPAEPKAEPPPKEIYGKRHEEAMELVDSIVERIVSRYEEAVDSGDSGDAKFPGGTGVEYRSSEEPPADGETYAFPGGAVETADSDSASELSDVGGAGTGSDAVAAALGLDDRDELPVQIVYKTGEGTGVEATAVVRAVMDFDPKSDRNHTIFQEVSVDSESGEVNVFPRLVQNRWR